MTQIALRTTPPLDNSAFFRKIPNQEPLIRGGRAVYKYALGKNDSADLEKEVGIIKELLDKNKHLCPLLRQMKTH